MEEKFKKLKEILKLQKQEEILEYPIKNKEQFSDKILTINFEQLNRLYNKAIKKEEIIEAKIEPISYIDKNILSLQDSEKYEKLGEKIIKEGKYAVVTMAGGQRNKIRT